MALQWSEMVPFNQVNTVSCGNFTKCLSYVNFQTFGSHKHQPCSFSFLQRTLLWLTNAFCEKMKYVLHESINFKKCFNFFVFLSIRRHMI